jgi:hypothetical protein
MQKKMLQILFITSTLLNFNIANAYTIGGAFAQLISCQWGQYGYQYGYIGTYNVNGQTYSQFFGNQYCPY